VVNHSAEFDGGAKKGFLLQSGGLDMSKIVSKTLSRAMMMQEKRLAVISNNLANANTSGYKSIQVSVEVSKSLTTEIQSEDPTLSSMSFYADFSNAGLLGTQSQLDVAIEGNGFFVISVPEGVCYTRDGRFTLDTEKRLVTSSGHPVMGIDGEIILDGQDITIEPDGSIYTGGKPVGRIRIVDFEKKELLQPVGLNLFVFTGEDSGAIPGEEYSVRQGFYEASNVDIMKEMVNLIDILRGFKAYDKAKKMAGDTTKQVVDLIAK
jgi:flagellar basal-body rod protein FlgF